MTGSRASTRSASHSCGDMSGVSTWPSTNPRSISPIGAATAPSGSGPTTVVTGTGRLMVAFTRIL